MNTPLSVIGKLSHTHTHTRARARTHTHTLPSPIIFPSQSTPASGTSFAARAWKKQASIVIYFHIWPTHPSKSLSLSVRSRLESGPPWYEEETRTQRSR